jgi:acyl-CoA dehydrogenase
MDVVGGKGICLGPSNFLARGYQGAPIAITVEGANILTRSMIIYGQGAIRCHPYVLPEMDAAHSQAPDALDKFDEALFGHIGFAMSNFVRSLWFGFTDGKGSDAPVIDETKRYYQQLNRYSANLALLSDISMAVLGGSLKRRERLSARLGDILSQLYLSSATLKRYDIEGRNKEDLDLLHWALQDSLKQTEVALDEFLKNFPNRIIGRVLKFVVMPFGSVRKAPSDQLESKVAKIIQTPCATRSRLGRHLYLTPSEHNAAGKIELALNVILQAEPIFDRVCKELQTRKAFVGLDKFAEEALNAGLISPEEAELLCEAEEHRLATINVDDFKPEVLAANIKVKEAVTEY